MPHVPPSPPSMLGFYITPTQTNTHAARARPSLMRPESTYLLKWETPNESNISYVHIYYQLYENVLNACIPNEQSGGL